MLFGHAMGKNDRGSLKSANSHSITPITDICGGEYLDETTRHLCTVINIQENKCKTVVAARVTFTTIIYLEIVVQAMMKLLCENDKNFVKF